MNDTEREVIILNSAWEMIDEMVNWAMFVKNECTEPTLSLGYSPFFWAIFFQKSRRTTADLRSALVNPRRTERHLQIKPSSFIYGRYALTRNSRQTRRASDRLSMPSQNGLKVNSLHDTSIYPLSALWQI